MTQDGYESFDDPYTYKGSATLKNKIGLRDPDLLEAFELEMTTLRAGEPLPTGRFDTRHYRRVHHHLFQDVFRWAGRYRTVRTAKDGNMFCFPEHIPVQMERVFNLLSPLLTDTNLESFIDQGSDFLAELNAIHPFREGNGRTQLAFMALLGQHTGFTLDLTRVRRATFLPAMIESYSGHLNYLQSEIRKLIVVK